MENFVFSMVSSDGPSREKKPIEKIFGWFNNSLRVNENLVMMLKTMPKNAINNVATNELKAEYESLARRVVDRCAELHAPTQIEHRLALELVVFSPVDKANVAYVASLIYQRQGMVDTILSPHLICG